MKKLWETGILLFAVAGFWGMIYPDLCFISDVCHVEEAYAEEAGGQVQGGGGNYGIQEDAFAGNTEAGQMGAGAWEPDIYTRICEAKPEQIKGKSRLLEFFKSNG